MIGKLIHIILRLQVIIVGILLQILIAYHVALDCIWCGKEIFWLYSLSKYKARRFGTSVP